MSEDHSYNGWKNYETWAVALWIDNEEASYKFSRILADEARDSEDAEPNGGQRTVAGILADKLKEWQEEQKPDLGANVWSDLLGGAFSEVDWYEIAEAYLSE